MTNRVPNLGSQWALVEIYSKCFFFFNKLTWGNALRKNVHVWLLDMNSFLVSTVVSK